MKSIVLNWLLATLGGDGFGGRVPACAFSRCANREWSCPRNTLSRVKRRKVRGGSCCFLLLLFYFRLPPRLVIGLALRFLNAHGGRSHACSLRTRNSCQKQFHSIQTLLKVGRSHLLTPQRQLSSRRQYDAPIMLLRYSLAAIRQICMVATPQWPVLSHGGTDSILRRASLELSCP